MDKPTKKKGQRSSSRKKRLQLDLGSHTKPDETRTDEPPQPDPRKSNTETQDKDKNTLTSTQSVEATDEPSSSRPKSASPEPNCAICLGKLENKSFTDSCFHMFCFVCLEEWSKVKAECPLCKQKFQSIIHNVRSLDDYDQYQVQQPPSLPAYHDMRYDIQQTLANGQRFRYRTTVTDHRYTFAHNMLEREREDRMLQRPTRYNPVPNWRRLRQPANSEFRRSVYLQKMKIHQDQVNTRRRARVRSTSPSFFRENPAQTHRLVPWLNRELCALLEGHGPQVAFVLELIMGLIKRFSIDSDEFYEHVYPFMGRRTRQFMAEFLNFAKSPYHMANYDRHVTYEPQEVGANIGSDSDSDVNRNVNDDGSDSDVIVVSPTAMSTHTSSLTCPGAPQRPPLDLDPWERSILNPADPLFPGFRPIVRSHGIEDLTDRSLDTQQISSVSMEPGTSVSGWESPINFGPNTSRFIACGNQTYSGSVFHAPGILSQIMANISQMPSSPIPSTSAPPVISNTQASPIACSESDDAESNASDIMIVDYEKPWEERSPIRLSSAEESDFDIMITGMSYATDPVKKERKKKKQKKSYEERTGTSEKRKRGEEEPGTSRDKSHKSKRRKSRSRSRSRSIPTQCQSDLNTNPFRNKSLSRSRSRSPIRMRLTNYSDYLHKKYHYHHPTTCGTVSRRGSYRSMPLESFSASSTDTGSDDESHVSIRSKKEKKFGHSSIEIVEYRKRRKYKTGKKHGKSKNSEKDRHSDGHGSSKSKKSKKDKTESKHKKSKKKSKHKKNKLQKKGDGEVKSKGLSDDVDKRGDGKSILTSDEEIDPLRNDSDTDNYTMDKNKKVSVLGTSDSELDSDTENESVALNIGSQELSSDDTVKDQDHSNGFKPVHSISTNPEPAHDNPSTLELVELTPFETAVFDKELLDITKSLPIAPMPESGSSVVNSAGYAKKPFKKHPHGHKKSGKNKQTEQTTACATASSSVGFTTSKSLIDENNIQSSDITSCTDIENNPFRPGFPPSVTNYFSPGTNTATDLSTGGLSVESINAQPYLQHFTYPPMKNFIPSVVYESPSSSGYRSIDVVDVETLSDGSDVDVTHVEGFSDSEGDIITDTRLLGGSNNKEEHIDVVGSSGEDSDSGNANSSEICANRRGSNNSDSTLAFNEDSIDITVDSDSDSNNVVVDTESETGEIDVLTFLESDKQNTSDALLLNDDEPSLDSDTSISINVNTSCVNDDSRSSNGLNETETLHVVDERVNRVCEQTLEKGVESGSDKDVNDYVKDNPCTFTKECNKNVIQQCESNDASDSNNEGLDKHNIENSTDKLGSSGCGKDVKPETTSEITASTSECNNSDVDSNERKETPTNKSQNQNLDIEHGETNRNQETPQITLSWTSNPGFEPSSDNNSTTSSFVSFNARVDDQAGLSPPYMATLYDGRSAELVLSADLPFEPLPQRSPGPLSPSSSLSDDEDEPDNFVAED